MVIRGKKYREMGPGTILGENAILNGSIVHGFTEAIAKTQVVTLKLKRSVFHDMFLLSQTQKRYFKIPLKSKIRASRNGVSNGIS